MTVFPSEPKRADHRVPRRNVSCRSLGAPPHCALYPPGNRRRATRGSPRCPTREEAAGAPTGPPRTRRLSFRTAPRAPRDRRRGRAPSRTVPRGSSPCSAARSAPDPAGTLLFVAERSGGSSRKIADIVSAAESPVERADAREHLVEDRPEGEQVRPLVRGLALHLLGRHVPERPHHDTRLRRRRGRRRFVCGPLCPSGCVSFARPKSRIFTRPSFVTNRFSGFRSRCTIPFSCAAARPLRDLHRVVDRLAHRDRAARQPRPQRLALEQLLTT